jgi:hypothetical protein
MVIRRIELTTPRVLELKLWTEKLHFSTVANILKISARGFFVNLIVCS